MRTRQARATFDDVDLILRLYEMRREPRLREARMWFAASFKPRSASEWYRQGGPDKFLGSTLNATLKQAGIKTVIICGNSFQGATVGTASGAAQRGYQVILPVDCSAGEDVYREQYATFHLTKGGPVIVTSKVTTTRSAMVKF